jgi:hypothetical protein
MHKILTIHEPPSIGRNIAFCDGEIQVCQNLHNLQEEALLIYAVNLHNCAIFHAFIINTNSTTAMPYEQYMLASGACSYGDYHRFDYEFKVSILKDKSLTWAQISSQADYQNQDQSKASKHSSFCISR